MGEAREDKGSEEEEIGEISSSREERKRRWRGWVSGLKEPAMKVVGGGTGGGSELGPGGC